MTTPEQIEPGMFFVKDGSQRHVVKVTAVSETYVTFTWFGIIYNKPKDEFCRYYTHITVPSMA